MTRPPEPTRRRRAAWSHGLTDRLGRATPPRWRPAALGVIKAAHTLIFASVGAAILVFMSEGLRDRPRRRAAVALAVAIGESAIYVSNNRVCPLTPLAEDLGASSGSVADIFLPDWASRRIPLIGGSALAIGLVLNLRSRLLRPRALAR